MPPLYTQNLGIEKPANGEEDGSWGGIVNENMDIIDRAINGSLALSLSGTASTLTTNSGTLNNGQYKLLVLGGTPSGTHTITIAPNTAQKIYFVRNTTAQSVVFTQGSGGNVTIAAGDSGIIYTNGAGASAAVVNLTNDFAMSSANITGGTISGITDLAIADGGTGASTGAGAITNFGITATAAELNVLDGITATAAELNVLDGITASTTQLNSASEDVNSENRIINGDFGIWQRSQSSNGVGYFAADRWRNSFLGGNATQSRFNFGTGEFLGTNLPKFGLRQSVTGQTLPSQFAGTEHRIEGVRSYAAQTITVLGWARRTSGSGNMALQGIQFFGTGGAGISSPVYTAQTLVTLTGAWAPFAVTMAVPTINGKTLGTDGNDYFGLTFYTSLGANFGMVLGPQTIDVDLWGIHIRLGTWAAADAGLYRPRDPGTEVLLCQRYYEVASGAGVAYASSAGAIQRFFVKYCVPKRAVPNSVTFQIASGTGTSPTLLSNLSDGAYVGFSSTASSQDIVVRALADAEL